MKIRLLTSEEGQFLVELIYKVVVAYIKGVNTADLKSSIEGIKKFKERSGVFVTLKEPKGGIESKEECVLACVGFPIPKSPLLKAALDASFNAAVRVCSLGKMEVNRLRNLIVEVSILTPLELLVVNNPIDYLTKIKIGQDGLMVEKGFFRGLLLPWVPVEKGWSVTEFLSECCMKAGLLADTWMDKGVKIYRFQAETFRKANLEFSTHS